MIDRVPAAAVPRVCRGNGHRDAQVRIVEEFVPRRPVQSVTVVVDVVEAVGHGRRQRVELVQRVGNVRVSRLDQAGQFPPAGPRS